MRVSAAWLAGLAAGLLLLGPASARTATGSEDSAVSPGEKVVKAEIVDTLFDKFLKYKTYKVTLSGGEEYTGGFVYGPGHNVSAIAALVFNEKGQPCATFKTGDTRLSRALRGAPYVATSGIAGRWDHEGYSAGKIVLGELSEEVGGQVVEGTFRKLGDALSPTMPFESTESDDYFMAAVSITGNPFGDGGQMEVADLIGPVFLDPGAAIGAMDSGGISDAARARTMFGRAWDAIGYIPSLGVYVQDYPELLARYDTLGLGPLEDLRGRVKRGALPEPRPKADTLRAKINSVVVDKSESIKVSTQHQMVDARIQHAVRSQGKSTPVPPDFASQYLKVDYDRAKVAVYYPEPKKGPIVEMAPQIRPALSFSPGAPLVLRRDIRDLR